MNNLFTSIATVIYIGLVLIVLYYNYQSGHIAKLNEIGDYLAGTFSPLALFWFVNAYLLQSKEIHNNTIEIARQTELLEKRNYMHSRANAPILSVKSTKIHSDKAEFIITNMGGTVKDIKITNTQGIEDINPYSDKSVIQNRDDFTIVIDYTPTTNRILVTMDVITTDVYAGIHKFKLTFNTQEENCEIEEA